MKNICVSREFIIFHRNNPNKISDFLNNIAIIMIRANVLHYNDSAKLNMFANLNI